MKHQVSLTGPLNVFQWACGGESQSVNFTFNTVDDLLEQIDKAADEFEFSKIDTYISSVENDIFTDDELEQLEEEYVILD